MPRPVLLTTGLLCLVAGLLGLRAGWRYATVTEGEAIAAAAAEYVAFEAERGRDASETECIGLPGEQSWLVVTCGRIRYDVSRTGRMTREIP